MSKRLRVLLVDDNVQLLQVLQKELAIYDMDVVTAADAAKAVGILIRDQQFNIVMSDVLMPRGLSGVQLAEMVLREYPQIGVILTSGYSLAQLPPLPPGVRFLLKPFHFSGLMAALKEEAGLN